jgi:hypothetical protein
MVLVMRPAKTSLERAAKPPGYWASFGSGCAIDGHASEPFDVSALIVFTLLWRDSAADA